MNSSGVGESVHPCSEVTLHCVLFLWLVERGSSLNTSTAISLLIARIGFYPAVLCVQTLYCVQPGCCFLVTISCTLLPHLHSLRSFAHLPLGITSFERSDPSF